MQDLILFLLIGIIVGYLVGFTGIGGGVLMTPVLILMGVPPIVAIGTNLLYAALTKLLASFLHYREDNIDLAMVKTLLLGSIPGSVAGILVTSYLLDHVGL